MPQWSWGENGPTCWLDYRNVTGTSITTGYSQGLQKVPGIQTLTGYSHQVPSSSNVYLLKWPVNVASSCMLFGQDRHDLWRSMCTVTRLLLVNFPTICASQSFLGCNSLLLLWCRWSPPASDGVWVTCSTCPTWSRPTWKRLRRWRIPSLPASSFYFQHWLLWLLSSFS